MIRASGADMDRPSCGRLVCAIRQHRERAGSWIDSCNSSGTSSSSATPAGTASSCAATIRACSRRRTSSISSATSAVTHGSPRRCWRDAPAATGDAGELHRAARDPAPDGAEGSPQGGGRRPLLRFVPGRRRRSRGSQEHGAELHVHLLRTAPYATERR